MSNDNWIESRFALLVDNSTLSEENEQLLKCLRQISEELEKSVNALYGSAVQHISAQFRQFDTDCDGVVDRIELKTGLSKLGLPCTSDLIESIFSFLSTNGTDVDYEKLVSMIQWTMSNTGKGRRSVYRGVSAAPLASGRLWQSKLQIPGPLIFTNKAQPPKFLAYSDEEITAAKTHDQALIDQVGDLDATPYLNFKDDRAMTEAQHQAVDREIARNNHMKNAGRTSVLRMLGRMIMSKRSLYGAKLADLHSSFTAIDVDNSGTLDRAELDKAFTRLGLGLSEKQKTEAAELLSCDHKDGLITWESYSKVMNEAKRAYAEEMKAHRTLMSTGILKPKKRYLQMPRSGEKGEQEWDIHFASVHESGSWDVDPDLRLEPHQRTNPFNDRDKERKNLNQVNEKSILNENSSIEERSSEALVTNGGSTLSNTEVPSTRRLGLTHQDEWSCIFHEDELQQSGLTTAPGSANWSPGSNTLRCHISENMKIVAYPGSAIRDGIVTDGSLVYEMRHGRGRGEGATYDDAKTRLLDWNDRTSMVASKFNPGRHTAFRDYFDRPVLLDTNGNLQLHHRHLPSRDEHVKSPVQRNRILHHLEVGEIPHMSTHDILQQFRGLRVASNGQSGLYEVRVPNTMPLLIRYTIHTVHETDYAQERKSRSHKLSDEERHHRNITMAIKVLNDAVQSGRKIYGMVVNNLKDLFICMDIENDGQVDFTTFETVIGQYHLGLSNTQLQALAHEFDKDGDGSIDYEEVKNVFEETIAWTKLHSGSNVDRLAKISKGIGRAKIKSQSIINDSWKEKRRKSLLLAQSGHQELLEHQMENENELENNVCPIDDSTLVGYYNSTENACRAYDAVLCARFGHVKSLPYMNMPESSPELWPKWQRDLYHNVTPPYLRINMTVSTPGDVPERPETPYLAMARKSHKIRAEWRKKRDEEWAKNGKPIHLKANFIGTPSRPSRPSTTDPTQSITSTMNSISEELDGTTRSQTSMGNRSSPNRSSLGRSSPGMGTSPQRKARYRNQNHVWVHYKKKIKKQKSVTEEKEDMEDMHNTSRSKAIADKILDNLIRAISSDRSLYGHQLSSIEETFMAFDKTGIGSLGLNELQDALKRLGVMATRPQIKKLIHLIDTDNSGRVEYNEFVTCLENRKKETYIAIQKKNQMNNAKLESNSGRSSSSNSRASSRPQSGSKKFSKQNAKRIHLQKLAAKKKKMMQGVKRLSTLDPQLLKVATRAFNDADKNKNGFITFPEFFEKMHGKTPSIDDAHRVKECRNLFKFWDKDNSGGIDLDEFLYCLSTATTR